MLVLLVSHRQRIFEARLRAPAYSTGSCRVLLNPAPKCTASNPSAAFTDSISNTGINRCHCHRTSHPLAQTWPCMIVSRTNCLRTRVNGKLSATRSIQFPSGHQLTLLYGTAVPKAPGAASWRMTSSQRRQQEQHPQHHHSLTIYTGHNNDYFKSNAHDRN